MGKRRAKRGDTGRPDEKGNFVELDWGADEKPKMDPAKVKQIGITAGLGVVLVSALVMFAMTDHTPKRKQTLVKQEKVEPKYQIGRKAVVDTTHVQTALTFKRWPGRPALPNLSYVEEQLPRHLTRRTPRLQRQAKSAGLRIRQDVHLTGLLVRTGSGAPYLMATRFLLPGYTARDQPSNFGDKVGNHRHACSPPPKRRSREGGSRARAWVVC